MRRVIWANVDFEEELGSGLIPRGAAARARAWRCAMSPAVAWLGDASDALLVLREDAAASAASTPSKRPAVVPPGTSSLAAHWKSRGVSPAPIVDEGAMLAGHVFCPWGETPTAANLARELHLRHDPVQAETMRRVAGREWSQRLAERLDVALPGSAWIVDVEDLRRRIEIGADDGWVLKAPWGTAGRDKFLASAWSPQVEGWARRVLARDRGLVLEPWCRRVLDVSVQIEVQPGGASLSAPLEIINTAIGRYRGNRVSRLTAGTEEGSILRSQPHAERLGQIATEAARSLAAEGYRGPAGLDAFVHVSRGGGEPALHPLCEINPRRTMGQVALALQSEWGRGGCLAWRHWPTAMTAGASARESGGVAGARPFSVEWIDELPEWALCTSIDGVLSIAVRADDAASLSEREGALLERCIGAGSS